MNLSTFNKLGLGVIVLCWGFIIHDKVNFRQKVDKQFKPFVAAYYEFLKEVCPFKYKNQTSNYTIKFDHGDDQWIGLCEPSWNGYVIHIDKDFWDNSSESAHTQLIFHEMSHCVAFREHVKDESHYMNPIFYVLPYKQMLPQLKTDLRNYCNDR